MFREGEKLIKIKKNRRANDKARNQANPKANNIANDKPSILKQIKSIYIKGKAAVIKHLWLELLAIVILALVAAGIVFLIVSSFINRTDMGTKEYVTYTEGREYVEREMFNIVSRINELNVPELGEDIDYEELEQMLRELYEEEALYELERIVNPLSNSEKEIMETIESDLFKALYTELMELVRSDKWTKVNAKQEIMNYYEKKGVNTALLTEKGIAQILSDSLNNGFYLSDCETYLVDGTGKIMYEEGVVDSLNLIKAIQKINNSEGDDNSSKFKGIYPVTIDNQVCYLYNESTIEPFYHTVHTDLGNVLGFIAATGVFILIIFRVTRDRIAYIEYLTQCLGEISKGNLNYQIEVVGSDELAEVAQSITHMENELRYQIDAQIQIEKSKNELVTNVAHDLRTPLTSIIGYIGLVKDKAYGSQEDAQKYLEVAYNKAENLKVIIGDLFELTKLHQRAVKLKKEVISLGNLLNQLTEELMPLANERNIEIERYIDANGTQAEVDIPKITRVFENLIENAIKYCPKDETIYIELRAREDMIYVAVSNPFENITEEEVLKFFERFYRGDKSRNSLAGGSGLGLAIAKNIVELHGGQITANINKDLISFKVTLQKQGQ